MFRFLNMIATSLAEAFATATKGLGTITSEAFIITRAGELCSQFAYCGGEFKPARATRVAV
jgi:hypothetical protein